jgi:hypothetical protein
MPPEKKQFPMLPKNINEAINQIREMQENLLFKGEQFIYLSKDENVVILTCPKNLSVLYNAQHVFGNGTIIVQNCLISYTRSIFIKIIFMCR